MKKREFKVTAIIAAYNEEDIIAQTVGDLIKQGIYVYFIDNHSTDATITRLPPFLATGLLQVEKFPGDANPETSAHYPWEAILRRKEELARDLPSDWFIHHDADEFRESPWAHLSLLEGIELVDRMGCNTIDFEVFEFQPTHGNFTTDHDVRETFQGYEPVQWFNKNQIRCWKKTAAPVELALSGGHQAEFQDRRVFPVRFVLRHYPVRSQVQGERKVFKDRIPRFLKSETEKNWHIQYNQISQGHCFIRDPSSLIHYDAEKVRLELFLNHREVESLRQNIALLQKIKSEQETQLLRNDQELDLLKAQFVAIRRSLEDQKYEILKLNNEIEARDNKIAILQQTNQAVREETAALRSQARSTHLLELSLASEQAKSNHLLLALEEARHEASALRRSWSWRITTPLRKVYEFLGLHRCNSDW